jgi:hypothetical protein
VPKDLRYGAGSIRHTRIVLGIHGTSFASGRPHVGLTDSGVSCAASSACRSRSGAAVAAEELRATTGDLQPP